MKDRMTCGITEIDNGLSGFYYGDLVLSTSRPGHGNIYLLISIARGICFSAKDSPKCLIFTNNDRKSCPYYQTGDEGIFTYYNYAARDLACFKKELVSVIKTTGAKIVIVENVELDFGKSSDFYRYLKKTASDSEVIIFVKANMSRNSERKSYFDPKIADIEGSAVLEQVADKFIIMHRLDVLGIKDMSGRDQRDLTDLRLCSGDVLRTDTKYILFDSEKRIFKDFTPEDKRYGYYYL